MDISFLITTRKRPSSFERMLDSAFILAFDQSKIEVIVYIDNDDEQSIEKCKELSLKYNIIPIIGERLLCVDDAYNICFKKATSDILMVLADDLIFKTKNWDLIVKKSFSYYKDGIVLVYGKDGISNAKRASHPILHRNWVETVGYVIPPYFKIAGGDIWITNIATEIDRKIYLDNLFIEHMHPCFEKAPFDETFFERKKSFSLPENLSQSKEERLSLFKKTYNNLLKEDEKTYDNLEEKRKNDIEKLKNRKNNFNKYKIKNKADILVCIPTRNSPTKLNKMVHTLFDTCDNKDNFIIQIIIDKDQINLYRDVSLFLGRTFGNNLYWNFVPHLSHSWAEIYKAQYDIISEKDCYFHWPITDDFFGLEKGWDTAILERKKYFDDDIFALYTTSKMGGRCSFAHKMCYTQDPPYFEQLKAHQKEYLKSIKNRPDFLDIVKLFDRLDPILRYHDSLIIFTKKFEDFVFPFFYKKGYESWTGLHIAAVIKFLFSEYGENRNIPCNLYWENATLEYSHLRVMKSFYELQDRGYDDVKEITKTIKEYVDQHKMLYGT